MHPLEERIGYKFRNPLLLAEALTHPSLGHETQQRHFDNQRLEFLGDAILQLVITEYLFGHFGDQPEGQLTKLRSRLVSRDALKAHAADLDLGQFLLIGRGEEASGGRARVSTLADAFEALLGAIYLDGGLEKTRKFILAQAHQDLAQLAEEPVDINPKGYLQELLQSMSPRSPVYEPLAQTGPEHDDRFVVQPVPCVATSGTNGAVNSTTCPSANNRSTASSPRRCPPLSRIAVLNLRSNSLPARFIASKSWILPPSNCAASSRFGVIRVAIGNNSRW